MKRLAGTILLIALFFGQMPGAQAVSTRASSAILMDAESGRVLYEQDGRQRRHIASITKLMTALTALESGVPLDRVLRVPKEAVGVEGSSMYLREGEEITLEALLYGLMLRSGNDAAVAVALCCGGSVEGFVARMNEKAAELGMEDSHFENPNGLTAEGHYSSAYDMALLARACLKNEALSKIVATKTVTIGNRALKNHNKLLWQYEGCVGLKTGYTEKAGRTLVSAARRNGITLVAVTLNDPDDWSDHAALLDWGFAHYVPVRAVQAGAVVGRLPVEGSLIPFVPAAAREGCVWPVGEDDELELSLDWSACRLQAPVEEGQFLGVLRVDCGGETVFQTDLLAAQAVSLDRTESRGPLGRLWERLTGG